MISADSSSRRSLAAADAPPATPPTIKTFILITSCNLAQCLMIGAYPFTGRTSVTK
jgi:hypothetical protein